MLIYLFYFPFYGRQDVPLNQKEVSDFLNPNNSELLHGILFIVGFL